MKSLLLVLLLAVISSTGMLTLEVHLFVEAHAHWLVQAVKCADADTDAIKQLLNQVDSPPPVKHSDSCDR